MQKENEVSLPTSAVLRPWMQDALALVEVSAGSLARELGLSRNTLYNFLSAPDRTINLDTAQAVVARLRYKAILLQVSLPPLEADQ